MTMASVESAAERVLAKSRTAKNIFEELENIFLISYFLFIEQAQLLLRTLVSSGLNSNVQAEDTDPRDENLR